MSGDSDSGFSKIRGEFLDVSILRILRVLWGSILESPFLGKDAYLTSAVFKVKIYSVLDLDFLGTTQGFAEVLCVRKDPRSTSRM